VIRINLLGVDRAKGKKAALPDAGQRTTLACGLVLVVAAALIGWWWWSLNEASTRLDAEIAAAQQEQLRLRSILTEVREFEQRRARLQQRVALIEQLRGGQSVPVQLLDHVSRSLPDMLWLTEMDQSAGVLTISGRSTTLIALSDFVGNLGGSPLLKRPIEIVSSQVESVSGGPASAPPVELIGFEVRAQLAGRPSAAAAAPAAARGGAAGGAR
jgi:type IV pilus assembly protein PilN